MPCEGDCDVATHTLCRKRGESLRIVVRGVELVLTVVDLRHDSALLRIIGPPGVSVHKAEMVDRMEQGKETT